MRLPRGDRGLESGEEPQRLRDPARPVEPPVRMDPLPRRQEADEVRRRDRLDLASQAVERVAMDPREQAPLAPHSPATEADAEHVPFRLEGHEERIVTPVAL